MQDWLPPKALRALQGVTQAEMKDRVDAMLTQGQERQKRAFAAQKTRKHELVMTKAGVEQMHK
eukprot:4271271-Heterocapsa_arctica.AAC.1